jgi:hypothetical protein
MKKKIIYVLALLAVILVLSGILFYPRMALYFNRKQLEKENAQTLQQITSKDVITKNIQASMESSSAHLLIPEKAYLEVPFFCQAPHQNDDSWKIHHASCEEAAALEAVYYDKGVTQVNANRVDTTLREMIAWQEKHFGVHKDIHADSVKMMLMGYFGYRSDEITIIRRARILDIKEQVAQGHPVVAPTYGRMLHNPFYKQPGPEYHMVTVIGYTQDRIITNDVGTKRGKDFSYDNDVFKAAMDKEGGDVLVIASKHQN